MSNSVLRTPGSQIFVHELWWADSETSLDEATIDSLRPYIARYAQTLGVSVLAVGGAEDHLHLLYELPSGKTSDEITAELQRATMRYLRETLRQRHFAWADASAVFSVAAPDVRDLASYISGNSTFHREGGAIPEYEGGNFKDIENAEDDENDLPDWLRDAIEE
jgi:REP element-mobilizing transposase RayT